MCATASTLLRQQAPIPDQLRSGFVQIFCYWKGCSGFPFSRKVSGCKEWPDLLAEFMSPNQSILCSTTVRTIMVPSIIVTFEFMVLISFFCSWLLTDFKFDIFHGRDCYKVDRKNPPPWRGFLFTMFPDQERGGIGPPLKNHPQNVSILGVVLHLGSSSSRFLIRENSKYERGVLLIKVFWFWCQRWMRLRWVFLEQM